MQRSQKARHGPAMCPRGVKTLATKTATSCSNPRSHMIRENQLHKLSSNLYKNGVAHVIDCAHIHISTEFRARQEEGRQRGCGEGTIIIFENLSEEPLYKE